MARGHALTSSDARCSRASRRRKHHRSGPTIGIGAGSSGARAPAVDGVDDRARKRDRSDPQHDAAFGHDPLRDITRLLDEGDPQRSRDRQPEGDPPARGYIDHRALFVEGRAAQEQEHSDGNEHSDHCRRRGGDEARDDTARHQQQCDLPRPPAALLEAACDEQYGGSGSDSNERAAYLLILAYVAAFLGGPTVREPVNVGSLAP